MEAETRVNKLRGLEAGVGKQRLGQFGGCAQFTGYTCMKVYLCNTVPCDLKHTQ